MLHRVNDENADITLPEASLKTHMEQRPDNYPKLADYKPTRFMLPTSHYDEAKADRAVRFIENLRHTKGRWAEERFWLLPWQERIVRDVFGVVTEEGYRQFRTAYVEIPKKNGKSELAAAIALYLLYADGEPSAEVYGAAADRQQASIVFDVARRMVEMTPALLKRSKIMAAGKRLVNYDNAGFYQVLSAEISTKHGLNVSALVLDELHAQPNRNLVDVLTKGSGDARTQPFFFLITTAGTDRNSICYEYHSKAADILDGKRIDPTFYPVIFGLEDGDDWNAEENWYKANPSLGYTIQIDRVRDAYRDALQNPAEENVFRQLRLDQWVGSAVTWIPEHIYDRGAREINPEDLRGRDCYAGLDLSSTSDMHTLMPWLIRIEQAIIKDVLMDEEKDEFFPKFNVDGLMRGDYKSRMEGYAVAITNGIMSVNDVRKLENLDPLDDSEGGNLHLINGSYTRLSQAGLAYGANAVAEREKAEKSATPDEGEQTEDQTEEQTEEPAARESPGHARRRSERRAAQRNNQLEKAGK